MNSSLFNPPDADQCHAEWKANCGPCAFAALLGRRVEECRPFFPQFPAKPWTNPTHLKAALDAAGVKHTTRAGEGKLIGIPRGLVFVQFDGPWLAPGVPIAAAYKNTHWVAADDAMVYDANAREWITEAEWRDELMPFLVSHTRRATGWFLRTEIEVPA